MEIGVPLDVKKFIRNEVKSYDRREIVKIVGQAYQLVDEAMKDVSFLNWGLGEHHKGYLDHIAVQFLLREASNSGMIGFDANILPNVKKSSYHVELNTDNVKITVNRTEHRNKTARKAIYRSILQKENQLFWTFGEEYPNIKEEPAYLQLTHKDKEVGNTREIDFVILGVPTKNGNWYSSIDLTREPQLVSAPTEESNTIDEQQLVKFKELAQGVHDSGGKKQ